MKTVLFADDELHYIEGLMEAVRAEGFEVLTCRNASKAIELCKAKQIDCLVIDIMMEPGHLLSECDPQTAGLAAIDIILKHDSHQSIVCFSVVSDPAIIKRFRKLNVLYLRKAETSGDKALKIITAKVTGVYRHNG